eukprot:UN0906
MDVYAIQKAWGDGIVSISDAFLAPKRGDYVAVAEGVIKELYGYDVGKVLFKPTKAAVHPFRSTSIGALSYFVGYDVLKRTGFSEDTGFAINDGQGWSKVRFDNNQTACLGDLAVAMGYYYFTNAQTDVTVGVEYTFVYTKSQNYKIMLHHSSLPFVP